MKKSMQARIAYWERELEKAFGEKKDFFVLLGRIACQGSYCDKINHDNYTFACESITNFDAEVQSIHEESLRLEEQVEHIGNIQEKQKALKKENRDLKAKEVLLYENLGRSAWESWKSGSYIGQDIEKALKDLIRAEERLHTAQDAVYRNGVPGEKPSLFKKGKIRFLSEKRKLASTAMERLWGASGRKIAKTIVAEKLSGSSMESYITETREIEDKREDIQNKIKFLAMEASRIESNPPPGTGPSDEVPPSEDAKKTGNSLHGRIRDNEARLKRKRDSLESSFYSLAELWLHLSGNERVSEVEQILADYTASDENTFLDTTLTKAHTDCQKIIARIALCRKNKENLLNHKEYENLKKVIKKEKDKIKTLKIKIENEKIKIKKSEKKTVQIQKDLDNQLHNLSPLPEKDD